MNLGRLFWKFFAFIAFAQLAGIIAIGTLFWLTQSATDSGPPPPPPFERSLHGAGPPPHAPHHGPRFFPPLAPTIATFLASLGTAALLAWYVAKPIRGLRQAFLAASGGRLDHRVAPSMGARQDELADLGREFDRMAAQLQAAMERQRRLLHDVSHEVRSPLARLQAAVGLLRQSPSPREATIDRIEEEIARIDRLIGELLRLSRLEAGEHAEDVQDIDMRELVGQVVSDARFESQAAGLKIAWNDIADATVRGRPEMLHVAFDNVVRNAVKYAASGGTLIVETCTDAAGPRFFFRVIDQGPGVREQDLDKLFTPFFRSDGAASAEGYGLGLAIAKRSVEAHGGWIRAQNRPAGGLMVEIALPMQPEEHTA
jgi:two-component system OmpR family sensor kinase